MTVRRFVVRMTRTSVPRVKMFWSMTITSWMVLLWFVDIMWVFWCYWPAVAVKSFSCAMWLVYLYLVHDDLFLIEIKYGS